MKHPVRFFTGIVALVAVLVTLAALSRPSDGVPAPAVPSVPAASRPVSAPRAAMAGLSDRAQLQRDADMTQQMSTPKANGAMQTGQTPEPMLQRSQDPGYVRALEQYQADIDRMLARNP